MSGKARNMAKYMGHLQENDRMHHFLKYEIQPQLSGFSRRVRYRVFQLASSNDVYLYDEKYSGQKVIGKFFLSHKQRNIDAATRKLNREYNNLSLMRNFGFAGYPHYIARPLGRNDNLNKLLVIEFCHGEQLDTIIQHTIHCRDDALLFSKLTALAYFLASFHNRTANRHQVDFNETCSYFDHLIDRLQRLNLINQSDADELSWLLDRWKEQSKMWSDCQVLVHGDATPSNFLFGDGLNVISFDLERLHRSDRLFDVGRLVGELQHFFMNISGNKHSAERFIGHFLWEYACHFPDREAAFRAITARIPFYMGITLLRIARNDYLVWNYRKCLVHEAKLCLRNMHL
jgi:aminoglycoside phosphotransferase (APT) family kinase protein